MRKGELRCTTLPFPNIQHTGRWIETDVVAPSTAVIWSKTTIWSDGKKVYYSSGSEQYVLDNGEWKPKEWDIEISHGGSIWTDGANIYCSKDSAQYVLDNGEWKPKEWNVETLYGSSIWTDGINIYYSHDSTHYVLDNGEWKPKTWGGLDAIESFRGGDIWSDGERIYYAGGTLTGDFVLEGETWKPYSWNVAINTTNISTSALWTDGTYVYKNDRFGMPGVLHGDTWESQTWNPDLQIKNVVWTDGKDIYSGNYVLERIPSEPTDIDPSSMLMGWLAGRAVASKRLKQ